MLIRKPPYLLLSLIFLFGCKKDKQTYTYNGIVLHQSDNTPVTDAKVTVQTRVSNVNSLAPEQIFFYDTYTNSKGEYSISLQDLGNTGYYSLHAKKGDLQQASLNTNEVSQLFDTIYLEGPSYLKFIVNIKTMPPSNGLDLTFEFFNEHTGEMALYDPFITPRPYHNTKTDTFLFPFAITRTPKAHAKLSTISSTTFNPITLAEKEITLEPYKTTEMLIEY